MPETFQGDSGTQWLYDASVELGHGSFGVVHPGEGPGGEQMAIKVLDLSHPRASPLKALMREVQIADRIRSEDRAHLLPALDHAVQADTLLLVMDRAEGSLADSIAGMSEDDRLQALRDVAAGLVELHSIPILHRDLKPKNVLRHDNTWKLADFGIARDLDASTATLTWGGAGTLPYMAPELFNPPYAATVKSDLYALGCIGFELWMGTVPFHDPDSQAIVRMHKTTPVPALPDSVNIALRRLILRLLDKDPGSRPQDARAVAEALARIVIGPATPEAARLQELASRHVDERAASAAAASAAQEANEARRRVERQAIAELRAIVEEGADLIREGLPDVEMVKEHVNIVLKGDEATLTFEVWHSIPDRFMSPPIFGSQTPPPSDLRADHLLYGQADGSNQRMTDEPPLGNIVCEIVAGRLEWVLYRYRWSAFAGPPGRIARRFGFLKSEFFSINVYPNAFRNIGGLHVFTKESFVLTPATVRDLYIATLLLPDE